MAIKKIEMKDIPEYQRINDYVDNDFTDFINSGYDCCEVDLCGRDAAKESAKYHNKEYKYKTVKVVKRKNRLFMVKIDTKREDN